MNTYLLNLDKLCSTLFYFLFIFLVTLYFKVSLLQCNYTFKYWVILINYMYLLYGYGNGYD